MASTVLLGPQRFSPTVAAALDDIGARGPIAVVTAGWQERESEVEELDAHIGRATMNLSLYRRFEEVLLEDRELAAAHRRRQERLRQLQDLYRARLEPTVEAARDLLGRDADPSLLDPEQDAAIEAVRLLDAHHLRRIGEIHAEFEGAFAPGRRPAILRHRRSLARILADSAAVLVAGGHVAVLLNRLRLFDVGSLAAGKPIVAWSAGAMALAERVVLFHDSPAGRQAVSQVVDQGLALFPALVPLPHARRRLKLSDPVRVRLFARRFAPAACVALDPGSNIAWNGQGWRAGPGTVRLAEDGGLAEMARP